MSSTLNKTRCTQLRTCMRLPLPKENRCEIVNIVVDAPVIHVSVKRYSTNVMRIGNVFAVPYMYCTAHDID